MENSKYKGRIYERFKNYDKEFTPASSEILFPPYIYKEIEKYLYGNILDVGTGDGFKLENLLKKCESDRIRNVVAIDPSPLFKIAKARFNKYHNIVVQQVSLEDFYSDQLFDTIFLFDVIEHTYNPKQLIEKIISLLKSDGTLIISTPNRPIYNFTEFLIKRKLDPTHVSVMNFRKFKILMLTFFKQIKILGILPMMKPGRKLPFLLKLHKYIAAPPLYNNIICFASHPKKNKE